MSVSRFVVTPNPLDLNAVIAAVSTAPTASTGASRTPGAVASFLGLVRDHNAGRRVAHLEYEAYEPLALKTFDRIATESRDFWPSAIVAIHHRVGRLGIGETSVAIATASAHRVDALSACRYAIERLKQIAPIWKHEFFEGGDVWIEGATADPEDATARAEAHRRSCA